MAEETLRIPFNDLKQIVVKCTCNTEITFNIDSETARQFQWEPDPPQHEKKDLKCPMCPHSFSDKVRSVLSSFMKWSGGQFKLDNGEEVYLQIKRVESNTHD
jgi:hypothetical protein